MDEIEAAKTKDELQKLQVKYAWMGLGLSYGGGSAADEKNVTMNIYNLIRAVLLSGAKDYYLNNDAATVAIREAISLTSARCSSSMVSLLMKLPRRLLPYSFTKQRSLLSLRAVPNFVIL